MCSCGGFELATTNEALNSRTSTYMSYLLNCLSLLTFTRLRAHINCWEHDTLLKDSENFSWSPWDHHWLFLAWAPIAKTLCITDQDGWLDCSMILLLAWTSQRCIPHTGHEELVQLPSSMLFQRLQRLKFPKWMQIFLTMFDHIGPVCKG